MADLLVRPDADVDYEISFTGPRGAALLGPLGGLREDPLSAYSQQTGVVEITVPRAVLELQGDLSAQTFNLYAYAGLEVFGSLREVIPVADQWTPGGGDEGLTDPNVFDLVGADAASQAADLSRHDPIYETIVGSSILPLRITTVTPTGNTWTIY